MTLPYFWVDQQRFQYRTPPYGYDPTFWFVKQEGECPGCHRDRPLTMERMSTAYSDPDSNYLVACAECHEQSEEMWADQWAEYHRGLL